MNNKYNVITVDGKQILEHRYLMEKKLGRKLLRTECVHHIDENCRNNSFSNLVLVTKAEHNVIHFRNKPKLYKRMFRIFITLPKTTQEGEIVSLLPEYRTYITKKCCLCNKLFWTRKDYSMTRNNSCSQKCRG